MLRTCLAAALFALAGASGCARVPVLKRWYKPPYYTYIEHPKFSFEHPRKWAEGVKNRGGVEFKAPDAPASFAIAYLPEGSAGWKPPQEYRRLMAGWGAVEDEHVVYEVAVGTRPAHRVRYTTYDYDPGTLLGEQAVVWLTEVTMVPDREGMFLIRYRAPREAFWARRYRKHYERFLATLVLAAPKGSED